MGVGHHTAEDDRLAGRTICIHDRDLVNFASCSYLALEFDPRIVMGVVDAATRYGTGKRGVMYEMGTFSGPSSSPTRCAATSSGVM